MYRKPVYAMIFLFKYRVIDKDKQETSCPPHVWFANQVGYTAPDVSVRTNGYEKVPEFACASVALLNIVNNIPGLQLGTELRSFKEFTQTLEPLARGDAIAAFDFVRGIHNSFARELDMLNVDLLLKQKQDKLKKKRKTEAAQATREANKAKLPEASPTRRSSRQPKPRIKEPETQSQSAAIDEDSEGFHFIAYMPINDEVWKLDGMDKFPQNLGKVCEGADWLSIVQPALHARMAQYEEGHIEFNLMAVVQDPLTTARKHLAENIRSLRNVETRLDFVSSKGTSASNGETVDTFVLREMDLALGISEADIQQSVIPESILTRLQTEDTNILMKIRHDLITNQSGARAAVRDEMHAKEADAEKATLRRHDYKPLLTEWLKALKEQDSLDTLLAKVQAKV